MRSLILTIATLAALPGLALAGDLHQQADSLFKPRPGRPVTSNDAGSANTKSPPTQDTTTKDATKQEKTKQ